MLHVARSRRVTLGSRTVGALPIVNALLHRLRLEEFLDAYLPTRDPRAKMSIAQALLVLVRNALLSREPLYGLQEWAEKHVPGLLGLGESQVGALNDDRVGRCLDELFQADHPSLLLALVAHMVKEFQVDLDELHNDSTTVTFSGKYREARPGSHWFGQDVLHITFGHNKDHRPDLKQLLFILTVADDGGVPVYFTAADGNLTDDQTHRTTWDLLCRIAGRRNFLYVADSKLATHDNMIHLHERGGRFLTVLPRTRAEDGVFRTLVREQKVTWKEIDRRFDEDEELVDVLRLAEHPMRTAEGFALLWYHSSRKQELDTLARMEKNERALQALAEYRQKLNSPRTRKRLPSLVEREVRELLEKLGVDRWIRWRLLQHEDKTYRQQTPGRPGKHTLYQQTVRLRLDLEYDIDAAVLADEALGDGIFPLVTNDPDLAPVEALRAYKRQAKIEKRHAQLKTDFRVAPVYVKSPARVEALLCVYFLVLLISSLIERELRRRMAERGWESVPLYPEQRPCKAPTARRLFDVFENIQRHDLRRNGQPPELLVTELSRLQRRILKLLDLPRKTYAH